MARVSSDSEKIQAALKKLRNEANAKELELIELVASVYESAKEAKDQVVEKVKDTVTSIDDAVHTNPWPYIGGAALLGLMVGRLTRR